jgi:UDP-N-acetylmuramoyl-L-alanyl-D-glutamate--2,6-diaminopimelate ligase
VKRGALFFAFPGARADGRGFAAAAVNAGAVAVVSELPAPDAFQGNWIQAEHGRHALALASRNFFRRPDERISLTGITGTNGKTTTAYLLDSILRAAGKTTALITDQKPFFADWFLQVAARRSSAGFISPSALNSRYPAGEHISTVR